MSLLQELFAAGALAAVDVQLARALGRIAGEGDERVLLAAALASRAVRQGHVCVDLGAIREAGIRDGQERAVSCAFPPLGEWLAALGASPLSAAMPDDSNSALPRRPLVLDSRARLYLFRYAEDQLALGANIRARLAADAGRREPADEAALARYFPGGAAEGQLMAARAALDRRFCVISGGPGTGKTTAAARILGLWQEQAGVAPLRIELLAPTGKAAQRMGEAIAGQLAALPCAAAVREALGAAAERASTIHRALGSAAFSAGSSAGSGRRTPKLLADAVIVDEASMIDLGLFRRLVEAVRPGARLVLLGDEDQLASVEAGAVFGDICRADLGAARVRLGTSFRYRQDSAMGELTVAIRAGDADRVVAVLREQDQLHPFDERNPLSGRLGQIVRERIETHLAASTPVARLQRLGGFRLLCGHRRGPAGAVALNAAIELDLARRYRVAADSTCYDGRPILVTHNDPALGLFNGDVGVLSVGAAGDLAHFAGAGGPRAVPVARLPPHETAFAMTVHKSQGSEWDEVALVLPERPSPVLTRELIYTAVSRARRQAQLFGSEAVLRQALARRVARASGLTEQLSGR